MADPRGFDLSDPRHVEVFDELTLWSALAGSLLLDHVPLTGRRVLDLGCGAGFPLFELAERLGPGARVVGLDPWEEGLRRAGHKRERWPVENADLVCGDGATLPFVDQCFDRVVSNLGVNNFERPEAAFAEVARVLRPGGTLALTTNLVGHMRELYAAFERVLAGDAAALKRLRTHVAHRATIDGLRSRLGAAGLRVTAVHEREIVLRFASAEAMFEHHLMRIGFRPSWEEVAGSAAAFERLRAEMEVTVRSQGGELRLTVPLAYIEARRD